MQYSGLADQSQKPPPKPNKLLWLSAGVCVSIAWIIMGAGIMVFVLEPVLSVVVQSHKRVANLGELIIGALIIYFTFVALTILIAIIGAKLLKKKMIWPHLKVMRITFIIVSLLGGLFFVFSLIGAALTLT